MGDEIFDQLLSAIKGGKTFRIHPKSGYSRPVTTIGPQNHPYIHGPTATGPHLRWSEGGVGEGGSCVLGAIERVEVLR